jgi:hypothetical protein
VDGNFTGDAAAVAGLVLQVQRDVDSRFDRALDRLTQAVEGEGRQLREGLQRLENQLEKQREGMQQLKNVGIVLVVLVGIQGVSQLISELLG